MALGLLYRIYERKLLSGLDPNRLPKHIGVVLDGHRRHARAEGMPSYTHSYKAGMERFEDFLGWADDLKIPAVTAWVLSPENLSRPAEELDPYFDVLIDLFGRLPAHCAEYDMALRFIGSLDLLPARLVEAAKNAEEQHPSGSRRLNVAMGYGGRQEIVDATKDLVASLAAEGLPADQIAERIDAEAPTYVLGGSSRRRPDHPDLRGVETVGLSPLAVGLLGIRVRRRQLARIPPGRLPARPPRLRGPQPPFRPVRYEYQV